MKMTTGECSPTISIFLSLVKQRDTINAPNKVELLIIENFRRFTVKSCPAKNRKLQIYITEVDEIFKRKNLLIN